MKFNLSKFLGILTQIGPVVLAAVPGGAKIAPLIPTITSAITEAEQLKGASGAEKKAHVMAIVHAGVVTANATGKVSLNPEEVAAIASQGIDTVVSTANVIQKAKPIPPPSLPPQE